MNDQQPQQEEQPILNRFPLNIANLSNDNPSLNNQQAQNIPEQSIIDNLSPSEVVDIGSFLIPSLLYIIGISLGLTSTKMFCSNGFEVILKIMLGVNVACITRAIIHVILIGFKENNSIVGKESLRISGHILYVLYYIGAIACFIIFIQRPDECFKSKLFIKKILT